MPIPFLVPVGMMAVRIAGRWVLKKISKKISKELRKKVSRKRREKIKKLEAESRDRKLKSDRTGKGDPDFSGQPGVNKRGYKPGEKIKSPEAVKRRKEALDKLWAKRDRELRESQALEKAADKLKAPHKETRNVMGRAMERAEDYVAKNPVKGKKPGSQSKIANMLRTMKLESGPLLRAEKKIKAHKVLQSVSKKKRIRKRPDAKTRAKAEESAKRSRAAEGKRIREKNDKRAEERKEKRKQTLASKFYSLWERRN